jgi:hypothetical protein
MGGILSLPLLAVPSMGTVWIPGWQPNNELSGMTTYR